MIPTSVAPVTFFVREDADWMPPAHGDTSATETAGSQPQRRARAAGALQRAGASFFPDIVRATRLLKSEVEAALWELVAAGLVTADGFDNLRALDRSAAARGHGIRPDVAAASQHGTLVAAAAASRTIARPQLEATCWMLLRRYGVVFRELLARESDAAAWRELLITFRRLEDRGEIRGGRFVSGFIGEQFALPVAVESLRALRGWRRPPAVVDRRRGRSAEPGRDLVPGERVAANSGRFVTFRQGVAETSDTASTLLRFGAAGS